MKKFLKLLGILAVILLIVIFLDVGCVIRKVTGFPCPGCGTTRAWLNLFKGHVVDAFYWHPLFWLTVPLLLVAVIRQQNLFRSSRMNRFFWLSVAVMYLTVYVVRMVMLFPHTAPMDYNYHSVLYQVFQSIKT